MVVGCRVDVIRARVGCAERRRQGGREIAPHGKVGLRAVLVQTEILQMPLFIACNVEIDGSAIAVELPVEARVAVDERVVRTLQVGRVYRQAALRLQLPQQVTIVGNILTD